MCGLLCRPPHIRIHVCKHLHVLHVMIMSRRSSQTPSYPCLQVWMRRSTSIKKFTPQRREDAQRPARKYHPMMLAKKTTRNNKVNFLILSWITCLKRWKYHDQKHWYYAECLWIIIYNSPLPYCLQKVVGNDVMFHRVACVKSIEYVAKINTPLIECACHSNGEHTNIKSLISCGST